MERPRSCPASVLLFYCAALVVQIFLLVGTGVPSNARQASHYVALFCAVANVVVILMMPLRDPELSTEGISLVNGEPTNKLRSPEDNLTLWQWFSVSWVAPLMSIGRERQLNDDDVWFLGFEFQHKRLHESFRILRGTVIRRLLKANGIDIFIITLLAILESVAGFSIPVLLQRLLAAMENPDSPTRVALTYALISLIARVISAQSEVMSLWFGRRCYERSRGEMIMMVYEKTLSRKHVTAEQDDKKSEAHENGNGVANGGLNGTTNGSDTKQHKKSSWWKIFSRTKEPRKPESKPPSSMGKILNLLRYVELSFFDSHSQVYSFSQRPRSDIAFGTIPAWDSMRTASVQELALTDNHVTSTYHLFNLKK